jgi:spore coat polysaccharide biosynthesis protein SpsF
MKVLLITQARVGSSRLPGKILKEYEPNKSLLELHLKRLKKVNNCDDIIVATTNEVGVDEIIKIAESLEIPSFQGSTDDVLDRFYQAAKSQKNRPEVIVRITSDCPLIDPELIDLIVEDFKKREVDYLSNTLEPTYPDGQDIEVFTFEALEKAWREGTENLFREHVTPYIWQNSDIKNGKFFKAYSFKNNKDFSELRMTLDYQNDLLAITRLIQECGTEASWLTYSNTLLKNEEIMNLNSKHKRNEGSKKEEEI